MTSEHEPAWRLTAYWLVVILFFSLPLLALALHSLDLRYESVGPYEKGSLSYLEDFHRVLAGILVAMLGLNTWDKHTIAKNGRV